MDLLCTNGISLTIDISPRHFLEISLDHLRWFQGEWKLNYIRIALDMVDIITIEGFKLIRVPNSEEVRLERQNNEGFELDWNKTWAINIDLAKACFPYEHKFAEAIQNELFSIKKWLKELHSLDSKKEKQLPCDLVIKVSFFFFSYYIFK